MRDDPLRQDDRTAQRTRPACTERSATTDHDDDLPAIGHDWFRRRDRTGYDCLRCDAAFDGEFDDDEHARVLGECESRPAGLRLNVSAQDVKLVLGGVRPESPEAAHSYQRLAEAVAHAEGRLAPWEDHR